MACILVVGGAGYIGSHTVKKLREQGNDLIVLDNLSKGHREAVLAIDPQIPIEVGELGDRNLLNAVFSKYKIDAVMHFAAFIEVGESVHKPAKYFDNNVFKVKTLLDVMLKRNIKNFVFSSTAAIFGNPQQDRVDEEHPQLPINPYGRSKLMLEWILRDYQQAYGLNYAILRYFNACGADNSAKIGQSYSPASHLIAIIFEVLAGKRPELVVYGTDYDTHDGSCIRDYIHVNDLADAHILALQKIVQEASSVAYNLGNGHGFSVLELIHLVEKISSKKLPYRVGARRAGDPAKLVANSDKAVRELNWQTQYSIEDIIKSTLKWEQNRTY